MWNTNGLIPRLMAGDTMRLIDLHDFNTSLIHKVVREEVNRMEHINTVMMIVGPVVLMTVGFIGNVLTIFVLSRRALRDHLFSVYLTSLCVCNIITLSTALPRFLGAAIIGIEFWAYDKNLCPFIRWMTFTTLSISSWHVVVITGCRLCYLLQSKHRIPTCIRPQVAIITMCCVICVVEAFMMAKGITTKDKSGYTTKCNLVARSTIIYIQFFIFCGAPAILLLFFNSALFFIHQRRESGLVNNSSTFRARQHLLILVLVSSFSFILTAFPAALLYMNVNVLVDITKPVGEAKGRLLFNFAVLLLYLNNSTNFLVYCCFGRKFRMEFVKLVRSDNSKDFSQQSLGDRESNVYNQANGGPALTSIMKKHPDLTFKERVISAINVYKSNMSLHDSDNPTLRSGSGSSIGHLIFVPLVEKICSRQVSQTRTQVDSLSATSERDFKKHIPQLQDAVLKNLDDYTFLPRRSSSISSSVDRRSVYFFNKVSARNADSP